MVYLTLCLWEEIWSSLAWMTTTGLDDYSYYKKIGLVWPGSTIAKIPSTEQDGVFNIMSFIENNTYILTYKFIENNTYALTNKLIENNTYVLIYKFIENNTYVLTNKFIENNI